MKASRHYQMQILITEKARLIANKLQRTIKKRGMNMWLTWYLLFKLNEIVKGWSREEKVLKESKRTYKISRG